MIWKRKHSPWAARIDLDTARQTLAYFRDDMSAAPDLARVCQALDQAIREIDRLEAPVPLSDRAEAGDAATSNVVPLPAMRFVPWTPAGDRS